MYWSYAAPQGAGGQYGYGMRYAYRAPFQPIWATPYPEALAMIEKAVQGERADELFYDQLIRLAPDQTQQAIIGSIRDDERGHNRMFRQMYQALAGKPVSEGGGEAVYTPTSYIDGLTHALMGELQAVETYRRIWFGLPAGIYKDTVYGIILDEQKHADKYNYLLNLNNRLIHAQ